MNYQNSNILKINFINYKSTFINSLAVPLIEKVKFTLVQATKAQRGSRSITLLFPLPRRQMGWVVNATPRPLYPRERAGTYCLGVCVGPRAGLDKCGKSRLPPRFDPPIFSPQRVAVPTETILCTCVKPQTLGVSRMEGVFTHRVHTTLQDSPLYLTFGWTVAFGRLSFSFSVPPDKCQDHLKFHQGRYTRHPSQLNIRHR